MNNLSPTQKLLALKRKNVAINVNGIEITATVKAVTLSDILPMTGHLPSVFSAMAGLAGKKTVNEASLSDEEKLGARDFMRILIVAGTVEPKLSLISEPDRLTPEDLDPDLSYENCTKLFDAISAMTDLEGVFRSYGDVLARWHQTQTGTSSTDPASTSPNLQN